MDSVNEQDWRSFTANRVNDPVTLPELGSNLVVEPRLEFRRELGNGGVDNGGSSNGGAGNGRKLDDRLQTHETVTSRALGRATRAPTRFSTIRAHAAPDAATAVTP